MDTWHCPTGAIELQLYKNKMKSIIGCKELTHKVIDDYLRIGGWRDRKLLPWEHCAMHFEKMYHKLDRERMCGIYSCLYEGKTYYYGIGLEEPVITDDMEQHGKWLVYTWAD